MTSTIRVFEALAARGGLALELAVRLDAVRGLGVRGALRRARAERALAGLGDEPWDAVYRRIWSDAASAMGASFCERGHGFFEIEDGDSRARVWRQYTELDGPVALQFALDRRLVFELLGQVGVPIPQHLELDPARPQEALPFLAGGLAVVKPAAGSGAGSGITSGIASETQLRRATLRAARYGRLVVERHITGTVYRLLYLDGGLLDAVRKRPPTVVGDGRSTVEDLVREENERRLEARGSAGFSLLKLDLDALFTLAAAGRSPANVPARGERIVVKSVTNQNRIEDNETVPRNELADDLVAQGAAAAAAVGLRLAGVDVVTPDPGRDLAAAGGRVIEVNGMPGLNHHYNVADPARAVRVAEPILASLLGRST
jgi:D-alanine-D-alanine ligase-like ATP-grasp enzyme